MKKSDPSEMGNEQGIPQLITFRELTGHGTEQPTREPIGKPSRFRKLRDEAVSQEEQDS